jgi:metal-responsive CopG/Arc/MetJ family transcriptional regulator
MKPAKLAPRRTKPESDATTSVRATISFPADLYSTLEEIAHRKKVSLAWVVREATERYVGEQWPLFSGLKHND